MKALIHKNEIVGELIVPGSKSHTIRALIIAALTGGRSVIKNPLNSDDCKAAMKAIEQFGAGCTVKDEEWVVNAPSGGLKTPDNVIDVGNSGTTLYFITSIASLLSDWVVFTGDNSIRRRPATPLLDALSQREVTTFTTKSGSKSAPFIVKGPMKAGKVKVAGNPSQYISSLLLASPMCEGTMRIESDNPMEIPYIEMTLDWMKKTGIDVSYDEEGFKWFEVKGVQKYQPFTRTIPSDWSSVAFPVVAGLAEGSEILINNLDFNDKQGDVRVIDYLIAMGANIKKRSLGSLVIKGDRKLKGINIDMSSTPDALPILAVVGSIAEGTTVLDNVAGARMKETDRVAVMAEVLTKMGVDVKTEENTLTIFGGKPLHGAEIESYGDHRIAMAVTVAGLYAKGETVINDAECASVTFPGFYEKLNGLGAAIRLT